jgi:hypothetical protein
MPYGGHFPYGQRYYLSYDERLRLMRYFFDAQYGPCVLRHDHCSDRMFTTRYLASVLNQHGWYHEQPDY